MPLRVPGCQAAERSADLPPRHTVSVSPPDPPRSPPRPPKASGSLQQRERPKEADPPAAPSTAHTVCGCVCVFLYFGAVVISGVSPARYSWARWGFLFLSGLGGSAAGGAERVLSPTRRKELRGPGGGARGVGGRRGGGGKRPSGNAAQRSLSEPRKKRKWPRKQGQIEPSSGISNELTRLGHSVNTSSLMSVRVLAPRTRPRCAGPARRPGRRRGAAGVLGAALLPRIIPLLSAVRGTQSRSSPAQSQTRSPCEISR